MFSSEICESFKNTYFEEHLQTTASKNLLHEFPETGIFPDNLKIADITLIFKKKDPLDKTNYPSVSILPIMFNTAWKVSVFGVILVRIFPHSDWKTERFSVSFRIQPECGKIRARITPNTGTFYAVKIIWENNAKSSKWLCWYFFIILVIWLQKGHC